jgi:hypothetical protein
LAHQFNSGIAKKKIEIADHDPLLFEPFGGIVEAI